ncbi:MAG: hypothetical protein QOK05_618 [Chloroflexota bacterium]|jgi:glyoxylase-like metal-dependent hydrolase (beta-lactamase superfamily II)|nr:hypothetical protein [Chloroflexota bacterium]
MDWVDQVTSGETVITLVAHTRGWRFRLPFPASDDELRAAAPDADDQARVVIEFGSCHVRHGDVSMVIDAGRLTASHRANHGGAEFTAGVEAGMTSVGIQPADVTHVLITHAHPDHFTGIAPDDDGGALVYPNARHLVSRRDWEGAGPGNDLLRRLAAPANAAGLLDLVEGDIEIAPGLTILKAPGETPGHLCLRAESAGKNFFWLGDLVHHRLELDHLDWVLAGGDAAAMEASRRRILGMAAGSNALVLWAHATFPGWARVRRQGDSFLWSAA